MDEGVRKPSWRVLLIGGSTAAGKSTSGRLLGRQLGIACLSADSVWKALMAATTPESHPAFHHFEPAPETFALGPDHLLGLHIEQAEAMTEPLEAFINWELHDGNNFIFEGAWITPDLAARMSKGLGSVSAVFVIEPEESEVLGAMLQRSRRTEPLPRQLSISAMAWRYAKWLNDGCQRLGIPAVAARPRDTLTERIIKATG